MTDKLARRQVIADQIAFHVKQIAETRERLRLLQSGLEELYQKYVELGSVSRADVFQDHNCWKCTSEDEAARVNAAIAAARAELTK